MPSNALAGRSEPAAAELVLATQPVRLRAVPLRVARQLRGTVVEVVVVGIVVEVVDVVVVGATVVLVVELVVVGATVVVVVGATVVVVVVGDG